MPPLTTIGGWAVVIAAITGYFYLQGRRASNKVRRPAAAKQASKPIENHKEPKARKARKDGGQSSGDQDIGSCEKGQKKKKKKQLVKPDREDESHSSALDAKDTGRDDELDNREFARQLSSAKTGTLLAVKPQVGTRQKSIKQSLAQEKHKFETSSDNASALSSVAGGDADDDRSLANSPTFSATKIISPTRNGDVSDMLEAPAPGPSVLRLTEPITPARPKKGKSEPAFEPAETKKQRQNRKKAEAKKLAREEEEKERKVLLEQQRRTAREAEGRAAKDGSMFMASKAPSTSTWTAPPPVAVNGQNSSSPKKIELLDTYEPTSSKAPTTMPPDAMYSESELAGSDWQKALPSEEEQMRFVVEDSVNWNIVKTKKGLKGKKKGTDQKPADNQNSTNDQEEYAPPPLIPPTGPGKKWGLELTYIDDNGEVVEYEKDVQDDEWEVA